MFVQITLDTSNPADNAALDRLFNSGTPTTTTTVVSDAPVAAPQAPAPAPKAAAKPKPQPKVEPVVEEPAEDLLGGEDAVDYAALRKAAVDAATVLVSSEGPARLKEALTGIGAKRVSEVPDEKLEAFIAAIA